MHHSIAELKIDFAGVAQLVERQPSKLNVASSSLVSRSIGYLQWRDFREPAQVAQG